MHIDLRSLVTAARAQRHRQGAVPPARPPATRRRCRRPRGSPFTKFSSPLSFASLPLRSAPNGCVACPRSSREGRCAIKCSALGAHQNRNHPWSPEWAHGVRGRESRAAASSTESIVGSPRIAGRPPRAWGGDVRGCLSTPWMKRPRFKRLHSVRVRKIIPNNAANIGARATRRHHATGGLGSNAKAKSISPQRFLKPMKRIYLSLSVQYF